MPKINITKYSGFTPANTAKGNLTGFTPLNNRGTNLMGFTLIELLVVISIIGFLATASLVVFNTVRIKARDVKRLADMKSIQTALALYYDKYNSFPDSDYAGCGGWDASGNGTGFIHALTTEGFLGKDIIDPLINDTCGNYCYYRYSAGSYACDSAKGNYFVLGVRNMETSGNPYPTSPGWKCSGRNWQDCVAAESPVRDSAGKRA